jgi:hypothetical protein
MLTERELVQLAHSILGQSINLSSQAYVRSIDVIKLLCTYGDGEVAFIEDSDGTNFGGYFKRGEEV